METDELDPNVWFLVSRRFCTVARLPEGMNGNEALIWALGQSNKDDRQYGDVGWAKSLHEKMAGDQFLRCYAEHHPDLFKRLTPGEFNAFKKAGGRTYY